VIERRREPNELREPAVPTEPGRSNESLSDDELLDREAAQRDDFLRREVDEPHLRDTTYRLMQGSRDLLLAWEQWLRTNVAVRLRGLISRERRRLR
jgi:hypothetical protein